MPQSGYSIRELGPGERGACESILRSLPEWFGIEESIVAYVRQLATMPAFGAWDSDALVGFLGLLPRAGKAAEIEVMAVLREHHRRGLGSALAAAAEEWLRTRGYRWLMVRTLGPSSVYEPYERTRAFYRRLGFEPLEETPTRWGPDNPCLLSVKRL